MKWKYSIVFLLLAFLLVLLLTIGYQMSYQHRWDRLLAESELPAPTEVVTTKGAAVKSESEGYYLSEQNGHVVVYLADKVTLYELTEIALAGLPEGLQEEIQVGKYIQTLAELYQFLQNYSS